MMIFVTRLKVKKTENIYYYQNLTKMSSLNIISPFMDENFNLGILTRKTPEGFIRQILMQNRNRMENIFYDGERR